MTSILSSISGIFSKALIMGVFLPVVVFIIFSLVFFVPLLPSDLNVLQPLQALDPQWKVIAITFFAILLSGLLYNLNIPLIRLYEGYPWRKTWAGQWRTRKHLARFENLKYRQLGMRTLQRRMMKDEKNGADLGAVIEKLKEFSPDSSYLELKDENCSLLMDESYDEPRAKRKQVQRRLHNNWEELSRRLLREFPGEGALVLPTTLGNTIRSFEVYPLREYGMDAIALWPRLVAKIDKDYAALIDEAKTSFDFMLNASALSALLAALILLAGLIFGAPLSSVQASIPWLAKTLVFTVLSFILYFQSIPRAANWGNLVDGAFDLYRGKLLEQMGFEQKPKSKEDERKLWRKISTQILYSDSPNGPRSDYAETSYKEPPTFASAAPADVKLEVSKGIESRLADIAVVIALSVKNTDATREAQAVLLTDTLPPELDYEWGSAHLDGNPLQEVTGTNPYRFSLDKIGPGAHVIVTYRAFQRRR